SIDSCKPRANPPGVKTRPSVRVVDSSLRRFGFAPWIEIQVSPGTPWLLLAVASIVRHGLRQAAPEQPPPTSGLTCRKNSSRGVGERTSAERVARTRSQSTGSQTNDVRYELL